MMITLARRAAAMLALLAPAPLLAQSTAALPPGVATADAPPPMTPIKVDGRQVRPGSWSYAITATGNGTAKSTRELTIVPATVNGAAAWLVIDTRPGARRVSDSLYLTRNDLTPLRQLLWSGPLYVALNYTRDSVLGMATAPQGSARIATKNVSGAMASGTMLELYLRLMPMKRGWKGNMAMSAVNPGAHLLIPVTVAVEGEETVTVPAGTFPSYVVVMNGMGTQQRAWVSKDTHDIVKVAATFTMPDGRPGAAMETVLVSKKP